MDNERRMAVLIDSENVSPKYVKYIFDEISNYGIATYKRAYGDWASRTSSGWKEILLKNAITPVQQYGYTQGKNSTDSAMIIDAMDILYSGRVDGFCIVSSDSDFTRLAGRLREAGMLVIGMGEKKTVEAFRTSCSLFKYLEVLAEEEDQNPEISREEVEETIFKIIADNDANDKETTVGELGNKLSNRHADFDVRNYGYSKLSKFLDSMKTLRLEQHGNNILVTLAESEVPKEDVEKIAIDIVSKAKDHKMGLPELKQKLERRLPNFNIRNYKYSKFSQFIKDMDGMRVKNNTVERKDKG
ncbi:MAG: NYN domain-containing protein [Lachnospiraceae bacterium]|nr:NYN domain-containing protein [Lachnospiraceae bacterium]MCR4685485.1 NYN domain-containing protein [Lachnospiraceae bacterium]